MDEARSDEPGLGVWMAAFGAWHEGMQRFLERDEAEAALFEEVPGNVEADLVDEQQLHQSLVAQDRCGRWFA